MHAVSPIPGASLLAGGFAPLVATETHRSDIHADDVRERELVGSGSRS
jgi:hypothetical protein